MYVFQCEFGGNAYFKKGLDYFTTALIEEDMMQPGLFCEDSEGMIQITDKNLLREIKNHAGNGGSTHD